MTKPDPTTIDPDLISALRDDVADGPDPAVQARVFSRLERRLAALAVPVSVAAVTTKAAASAPSTLALPAAASPAASSILLAAVTKPVGIALVAAAVGGAGTYALSEYTRPVDPVDGHSASAPALTTGTERALPLPSTRSAPATAAPSEVPEERPAPAKAVVRRASRQSTPVPSSTRLPDAKPSTAVASLGEQQALLDDARKALARGENRAVLDTLSAHSTRYPSSDLTEEREALAIKALVAAGQYAAARERGARFRRQFPDSLLMPSVTKALRAIP